MANVERANREFDQRAVFGLGAENQAEDLFDAGSEGLEVGQVVGDVEPYIEFLDTTAEATLRVERVSSGAALFTGAEGTTDVEIAGFFKNTHTRTEPYSGSEFNPDVYGVYSLAIATDDPAPNSFSSPTAGYFLGYNDSNSDFTVNPQGVSAQGLITGTAVGDTSVLTGLQATTTITSGYAGTVTSAFGGRFSTSNNSATATVTNAYGVYIDSVNDSTAAGNVYGLFIEDMTIQLASARNIHSSGAGSLNHFEGKLLLGGELELDGALNHDGSTAGFYGTAPIAKQTGVAVDAAAIHAALVALGLIGA